MVASIEDHALAGGWRLLCVGILHHAVAKAECDGKLYRTGSQYRIHGASGHDKERLNQRVQAREWLKGGTGTITFEECCEALGVDAERARSRILARAHERRRMPMSRLGVA